MLPARWKMLPWMNMQVSSERSTTFPLTAGSDGSRSPVQRMPSLRGSMCWISQGIAPHL